MRLLASFVVIAGLLVASPGARAQQPAFLVFFQLWSAGIDDQGQQVITTAADWVKTHHTKSVKVVGYADPTGSQKANVLLSELRAQVVVDGLTAAGVPADIISQNGTGAVPFAGSAQESRRVAIEVSN